MWTIIIIVSIAFIGSIIFIYKNFGTYWGDIDDILFNSVCSIVTTLLAGLFAFAISIMLPSKTEYKPTADYKIVSLQDNSSFSGSFFLGTGSIDGDMVYTYYYEVDGGFKLNQLKSDKVTIKYSDSLIVREFNKVKTDDWYNNFSLCEGDTKYEIFVPEGTIKMNYNLDAK